MLVALCMFSDVLPARWLYFSLYLRVFYRCGVGPWVEVMLVIAYFAAAYRYIDLYGWCWCASMSLVIVYKLCLKACAQRFRYALFAFIHTQTYFEYYTLTLRLASLVKKTVIYAYWTMELFDICRENVSHMATLPSVARHVIHADNLRPRH